MLLHRRQRFVLCLVSPFPQFMHFGIGRRFAIGFLGNNARFAIAAR
jgi:hypothetical protein